MAKGLTANAGQKRMVDMGSSVQKAKDTKGTLLQLYAYWKGQKILLFCVIVLSLIGVGCSLIGPYILGQAIDQCLSNIMSEEKSIDLPQLAWMLLLFISIHIFSAFCSWFQEYGMMLATQKIIQRIREELTIKLQSLSLRFFDNNLRGSLMSYFTNDVELLKEAMGNSLVQLISSILSLLGTIIIMAKLSPTLMAVTCITIPATILISKFIMSRTRNYFSKQQSALSDMNGMVEESIEGMKVIQSFGQEQQQIEKFQKLNIEVRETGVRAQIYSGVIMPIMRVLDNISYILVTLAGALLVNKGSITVGTIQAFLLYTKNFQRPINTIATQLNSIQSAIAGAERIFQLLGEEPDITDCSNAQSIDRLQGKVEFKDVYFGYHPSKMVLKGISFAVSPNETVAIVGTTGAGKTTIINLLTRFYEPQSGTILVDDIETRLLKQKDLRKNISIVLQDPYLFSESIRYNIAYGKEQTTDEEVMLAAQTANVDGLIENLPNRYDQMLHEQGNGISHGQEQLITIARAILSNAPILVLDEATSNIDTRTEILIQKAIQQLSAGRTCIIIAHRLSTIKNADKILVIDNGTIAECGTHNELLEKGGIYHQIYQNQFAHE